MLAHADKQNIRWCVPSDAEKPLLYNINLKQPFEKSINFDRILLIECQKKPLKFVLNISAAIFLATCCNRNWQCVQCIRDVCIWYALRVKKVKSDFLCLSLCETTRSKFEYGVSVNSHLLYLFIKAQSLERYRIARRPSTNFPTKAVHTAKFGRDYGLTVWKLCSLAKFHVLTTVGRRSDLAGKYSWMTVAFYTGRWKPSWIGKGCVSFSR